QYPGVLPVLAQMAATPRSDLNWNRLAPWRQLLARLWDAHGASALAHINSVDIHHAQGAQVRALLLLSWLASRLDWTLNTAERTASGGLLTRWRAGPALHDLKAELLPVAANGSEPGSLQGIYIQAGAEPPYVMPRLELAGDCVELRRDESSLNSQFMPFQPVDLTGALAAEIDNDPDPHLMAALDISAALLSELKS
ncbi:MAG: OpcA/G6PD domain-containing protein, partial [Anaerolineae bacterium]